MKMEDLPIILTLEHKLQHKPWSKTAFEQAIRLGHTCQVYEDRDQIQGYGVADGGHGRTIAAETMQIAGVLYRQWFQAAKEKGDTKLYAEVQPENRAARARLERFGFRIAGTRPSYYGPGLDALVYERLIGEQNNTEVIIKCS